MRSLRPWDAANGMLPSLLSGMTLRILRVLYLFAVPSPAPVGDLSAAFSVEDNEDDVAVNFEGTAPIGFVLGGKARRADAKDALKIPLDMLPGV